MMVGIIDVDLFINSRTFLPNAEVMLLSGYHKQKGDIVHLLMDGKNIDIYEKIYICRNKTKKIKFPDELYSRHNVECSGLYFTNGVVAPIADEVFAATPDKSIYDKYVRYWGDKPINGVITLARAKYVSYRKGFSPLYGAGANYIYDYDLGSEDDYNGLMELYKKGYFKKLNFCYPIRCESFEMALKWAQAPFATNTTQVLYPNVATWSELNTVKKLKLRIKIQTYVTNKSRFATKQELDELFISTMDKIIYCMVNNIKVQFKFNPKIKITDQFKLLKRLSDWSCSITQPSFYVFCDHSSSVERNLVEEFAKNHPEVKDWIYLSPHEFKKNGGIWLNDRRTN